MNDRQPFRKARIELPNGLVVIAVERRKLPIVHARLLVKVGSAFDEPHLAGISSLTAELLDEGTSKRSGLEVAEAIEFIGGRFSISSNPMTTDISLAILNKDLREGLDLLAEVVRDSAFREEDFEREKSKILSSLLRRKERPDQVAFDLLREMVYGEHPLHRPVAGYEETVEKITRDDLLRFYKQYYTPKNAILVMAADLSVEEMIDAMKRTFGDWPASDSPLPFIPQAYPLEGKAVRIVDMEINQSYIQFGHVGITRTKGDYNAVRVMNYLLGGGGFVSRLLKSIRSNQGLAYSVYSAFLESGLVEGLFTAGLQTKIESTSQALNTLLAAIDSMRSELVAEKELEDARLYFEGSLARSLETYSQIADLIMNQEYYQLPEQFWVNDVEEIKQLTREDILEAGKKYLSNDHFRVAIASKSDHLKLDVAGIEASDISLNS
ncbi:MAG: insulinase family protein [Candidatus Tectomicrobia bacterium]|nr:insulinase family protein [Candidatus Tectomicrobia bacterium]